MNLSRKVKEIIQIGLDHDLEIISYGLAPNPNGFCFEDHGGASDKTLMHFNDLLDALTKAEIDELRKAVFA